MNRGKHNSSKLTHVPGITQNPDDYTKTTDLCVFGTQSILRSTSIKVVEGHSYLRTHYHLYLDRPFRQEREVPTESETPSRYEIETCVSET